MALEFTPCNIFKYVYSVLALIFSITLVFGLIATKQTNLSMDYGPAPAYIALIIAIGWLTMVEGGQASLVGLEPVNTDLYKDSHPIALKSTSVCFTGDNLDRYLLGRQFMVVIVVFTVNLSGAPIGGASLWDLPNWLQNMFLQVGLAMILLTCMVGQLNTQVNASHCMLDYINSYFAVFTFYVAMAIEFSGLLHASYLVQFTVAALAGKKIESNEEPKSGVQGLFFWGRCLMSLAVLGFCMAVTFVALFTDRTTVWAGLPPAAAVVIFVVLVCVVGMLEGMQIAFFAVAKLQASERGASKFAKMTCDLLYSGKGNNLPGFMIGRQLCVVSCMFFVARVTSLSIDYEGGQENIFGVGNGLQEFFNTGLLGALMLTILGSISWQLVASAFPLAFLANPLTYILLRLCLFLESTGICAGAWVIAAVHAKIAGFQRDEVYIGTAEQRAKMEMGDKEVKLGVGHLVKLPGFAELAPRSLQKLMEQDPAVREYLNSIHSQMEEAAKAEDVTPAES